MVKVIFHTIRNCSYRKEFAPSGKEQNKQTLGVLNTFHGMGMISAATPLVLYVHQE